MKKITKLFSLLLVLLALTFLFVNDDASADEPLENPVSVEITASLDQDNAEVALLKSTLFEYGSNINFNFDAASGTFQVWIVDGYIRTDLTKETTFKATTNFKAIAIFSAGQEVFVYVDANGKHLETSYVEPASYPKEPSEKIGYSFAGFTLTETFNQVSLYRANYTRNEDKIAYTINDIDYDFNEVVTLNLPEGHTHWELDGKVVSYNPNYKFTALSDLNLTEGTGGIAENLVTLRTLSDFRDDHTTYLAQFELLDGFELVEYGLEVDGDGENRILHKFNNLNPTTNEMLVSTKTPYTNVSAYMIVFDEETNSFQTIYNHDMGALREYELEFTVEAVQGSPRTIYVLGSFNGWSFDEAELNWALTPGPNGYTLTQTVLAHQNEVLTYKYAGGLTSEFYEVDASGDPIGNREYTLQDSIEVAIDSKYSNEQHIKGWPKVEQTYSVTIEINVPVGTPKTIYLPGNYNGFVTSAKEVTRNVDGKYITTLNYTAENGDKLEVKPLSTPNWIGEGTYTGVDYSNGNPAYTLTLDDEFYWIITVSSWNYNPLVPEGYSRVFFNLHNDAIARYGGVMDIHYFGGSSATDWPGARMNRINNLFYYDIPNGSTFIFNSMPNNDSRRHQTANLSYNSLTPYYTNEHDDYIEALNPPVAAPDYLLVAE